MGQQIVQHLNAATTAVVMAGSFALLASIAWRLLVGTVAICYFRLTGHRDPLDMSISLTKKAALPAFSCAVVTFAFLYTSPGGTWFRYIVVEVMMLTIFTAFKAGEISALAGQSKAKRAQRASDDRNSVAILG